MLGRWKALRIAMLGACSCLLNSGYALAQEAETAATAASEKSYFLAYALVFMVIALGLAAICRPSDRADRPRMMEQDLEEKMRQMSGQSD